VSLSVRTRFEVFKRDRFTCAYCGRTPPEVLLHADHIVPKADGGPDDIDNLTTACQDCNLGKGARRLDVGSQPQGRTAEELQERIEQAQAYAHLLTQTSEVRRTLDDTLHDLVLAAWSRAWGGSGIAVQDPDGDTWRYSMPNEGYWPDWRSVRNILRRIPIELVYEAIEITAGRFPIKASHDSTRYFYGICWRMVREREALE
jgi:hypothetical protein